MGTHAHLTYPKRGSVYLTALAPAVGSEIKKTRPGVILQNDTANHYSPVTIVAAISSKSVPRLNPTQVRVRAPEGGLACDSIVLLDQIRTVDKQRLIKRLGALHPETMRQVNRALQISLALVEL